MTVSRTIKKYGEICFRKGYEKAKKEFEGYKSQLDQHEKEIAELQKQNATLHSINNEWEKDYEILKDQNARLKEALESRIREKDEEIARLKAK